jgi:hypothetical protein
VTSGALFALPTLFAFPNLLRLPYLLLLATEASRFPRPGGAPASPREGRAALREGGKAPVDTAAGPQNDFVNRSDPGPLPSG